MGKQLLSELREDILYGGGVPCLTIDRIMASSWKKVEEMVAKNAVQKDILSNPMNYGAAAGAPIHKGHNSELCKSELTTRAESAGIVDGQITWERVIMAETIKKIKDYLQELGYSEEEIAQNWEYIKHNLSLVERAGKLRLPLKATQENVMEVARKNMTRALGLEEDASWEEIDRVKQSLLNARYGAKIDDDIPYIGDDDDVVVGDDDILDNPDGLYSDVLGDVAGEYKKRIARTLGLPDDVLWVDMEKYIRNLDRIREITTKEIKGFVKDSRIGEFGDKLAKELLRAFCGENGILPDSITGNQELLGKRGPKSVPDTEWGEH